MVVSVPTKYPQLPTYSVMVVHLVSVNTLSYSLVEVLSRIRPPLSALFSINPKSKVNICAALTLKVPLPFELLWPLNY
jgi:hypothetical protein